MACFQQKDLQPLGINQTNLGTSYATLAECLQACKEGACCEGTTCSIKPQCQCQGAGKTFKGVGTTCSPNPCAVQCSCPAGSETTGARPSAIHIRATFSCPCYTAILTTASATGLKYIDCFESVSFTQDYTLSAYASEAWSGYRYAGAATPGNSLQAFLAITTTGGTVLNTLSSAGASLSQCQFVFWLSGIQSEISVPAGRQLNGLTQLAAFSGTASWGELVNGYCYSAGSGAASGVGQDFSGGFGLVVNETDPDYTSRAFSCYFSIIGAE